MDAISQRSLCIVEVQRQDRRRNRETVFDVSTRWIGILKRTVRAWRISSTAGISLFAEDGKVTDKVADANAIASGFTAVGRTDAFLGRAERFAALFGFLQAIDLLMEVEHQVSTIGDNQAILPILQAFGFILCQLLKQSRQMHDNAVT